MSKEVGLHSACDPMEVFPLSKFAGQGSADPCGLNVTTVGGGPGRHP